MKSLSLLYTFLMAASITLPAIADEPPVGLSLHPSINAELTPEEYRANYAQTHPDYKVVTGVVISKKEIARKAEQARNEKSDAEYKDLKRQHQLPSAFLHPLKRGDVWIDYHEDSYRKFRTRTLPATQFVATIFGAGCAAVAAFK